MKRQTPTAPFKLLYELKTKESCQDFSMPRQQRGTSLSVQQLDHVCRAYRAGSWRSRCCLRLVQKRSSVAYVCAAGPRRQLKFTWNPPTPPLPTYPCPRTEVPTTPRWCISSRPGLVA